MSENTKFNAAILIIGNEIESFKGNNVKKKSLNKVKDNEAGTIDEDHKSSKDSLISHPFIAVMQ